jgi:YigZ family protein
MTEYIVPYQDAESEFTEKRSRFITHLYKVGTEAEARARIEEMKKKYYDARHNCWCYLLQEGGVVRYSDDGEPQGTAGQPMLNVFQRENVENVVCIVTRYFGGILLGAGGLTRAYAKAAKDALDNAGKARMQPFSVLLLECPYPMFERIKLLIEGHEGRIESSDYGAAVTLTFLLPVQKTADFSAALTELSGGQMSAEEVEQRFLPGARE